MGDEGGMLGVIGLYVGSRIVRVKPLLVCVLVALLLHLEYMA